MFNFGNEPPVDGRGQSLVLLRCPTGKQITGIITSANLIGTPTHFYHGRTLPCDDSTCPACSEGLPWRWHGYVSLFSVTTSRHVLFEFTARAAEALKTYRATYGTLRGCLLTAKRAKSSANSRVIMLTTPADLTKIAIPEEPDILAALCIIWDIERPAIKISGTAKDSPVLAVNQDHDLKSSRIKSILDGTTTPPTNTNGESK